MGNAIFKADEVTKLIDHLFRHEAGKMVSVLTRIFGLHNLETAEDVVQDTLLKAYYKWPYSDIPDNPSAWLYRVAKNRALDILRREQLRAGSNSDFLSNTAGIDAISLDLVFRDSEIKDDQLRMIFVCCHPALTPEAQIALTLKTLCGFSISEIAKAFITTEVNITKRLYRARQRFREENVLYEIPSEVEISGRLDAVLKVIYLLFNEGYNSGHPEEIIRRDLCREAIRLCLLLSEHPASAGPKTFALLAHMCFNASRFDARIDSNGAIVLMKDQDRTLWDKELIQQGASYMEKASAGNEISEYHLEAGIAACYALAPSYEETDWRLVLQHYDLLMGIKNSPVIALNRAIVVGQVSGPAKGIEELQKLKGLENYYLYHASLGEMFLQAGNVSEARNQFEKARSLATSNPEIALLIKKIQQIKYISSI